MTPTSLIIVADRGSLKAYQVNETPNRGPGLHLVQSFELTEAHLRLQDKVTDHAGRLPMGDGGAAGGGRHASAVAERQGLESENDRRILKQLAESITDAVTKNAKAGGWSFAAPAAIHASIVDLLPPPVRERIVEHVKSDLVKTEPAHLPQHFRSLQPL